MSPAALKVMGALVAPAGMVPDRSEARGSGGLIMHVQLGINTCFAVKRWPRPVDWAPIVREQLGLGHVQLSLDLVYSGLFRVHRRHVHRGIRVGWRVRQSDDAARLPTGHRKRLAISIETN